MKTLANPKPYSSFSNQDEYIQHVIDLFMSAFEDMVMNEARMGAMSQAIKDHCLECQDSSSLFFLKKGLSEDGEIHCAHCNKPVVDSFEKLIPIHYEIVAQRGQLYLVHHPHESPDYEVGVVGTGFHKFVHSKEEGMSQFLKLSKSLGRLGVCAHITGHFLVRSTTDRPTYLGEAFTSEDGITVYLGNIPSGQSLHLKSTDDQVEYGSSENVRSLNESNLSIFQIAQV